MQRSLKVQRILLPVLAGDMVRTSDPSGKSGKADLGTSKAGHSEFAGATEVEVLKGARIVVTNAEEKLCHIKASSEYPCSPRSLYNILVNPDNTKLFRDVKKVTSRSIVQDDPAKGLRTVQIEQLGEVKILWHTFQFKTKLEVNEDCHDPAHLVTVFKLLSSEVMAAFDGSWSLTPLNGDPQQGTHAVLEQDVLPKGVPPYLKHVPLLGGVLRGICVRAVQRMLEDIQAVVDCLEAGERWEDIVKADPPVATSLRLRGAGMADNGHHHGGALEQQQRSGPAAAQKGSQLRSPRPP